MDDTVILAHTSSDSVPGYRITTELYLDTDRYLLRCSVAVHKTGLLFDKHLFSEVANEWVESCYIEEQIDSLERCAIQKLNNCENCTVDDYQGVKYPKE